MSNFVDKLEWPVGKTSSFCALALEDYIRWVKGTVMVDGEQVPVMDTNVIPSHTQEPRAAFAPQIIISNLKDQSQVEINKNDGRSRSWKLKTNRDVLPFVIELLDKIPPENRKSAKKPNIASSRTQGLAGTELFPSGPLTTPSIGRHSSKITAQATPRSLDLRDSEDTEPQAPSVPSTPLPAFTSSSVNILSGLSSKLKFVPGEAQVQGDFEQQEDEEEEPQAKESPQNEIDRLKEELSRARLTIKYLSDQLAQQHIQDK